MKKIFFTGGAGLLSLNWALSCKHEWHVILGTFNRHVYPSFADTISLLEFQSATSLEKIFSDVSPDIVINSAALTNIEFCEKNPVKAYDSNVGFASNVAIACNNLKIPLVHISTDHLFAGTSSYVDEKQVPHPLNIYARTKAQAETRVAELCDSSLIIRTNFFGFGTSYRPSFTDQIINELNKKRTFYGFNDVFFTPILVSDLAACIFKLLDDGSRGIFNVSSDDRVSKYQFAIMVAKVFNLPHSLVQSVSIKEKSDLVIRPSDMSLSNKKVSELLMRKMGSVEESLCRLFDQARDNTHIELLNL
jgi:dTDP-4-dehydrorhamnose reductase